MKICNTVDFAFYLISVIPCKHMKDQKNPKHLKTRWKFSFSLILFPLILDDFFSSRSMLYINTLKRPFDLYFFAFYLYILQLIFYILIPFNLRLSFATSGEYKCEASFRAPRLAQDVLKNLIKPCPKSSNCCKQEIWVQKVKLWIANKMIKFSLR